MPSWPQTWWHLQIVMRWIPFAVLSEDSFCVTGTAFAYCFLNSPFGSMPELAHRLRLHSLGEVPRQEARRAMWEPAEFSQTCHSRGSETPQSTRGSGNCLGSCLWKLSTTMPLRSLISVSWRTSQTAESRGASSFWPTKLAFYTHRCQF